MEQTFDSPSCFADEGWKLKAPVCSLSAPQLELKHIILGLITLLSSTALLFFKSSDVHIRGTMNAR
jgi:hypothetical protein